MPEATFNPYEILGCDPSATDAEIKAAYREAAQKAHPDRKGGSAEQMSLVNQAYQLLCDPQKRAAFDAGHSTELPFSLGRRAKDFVLGLCAVVIRSAPVSANMVHLLINGITNQQKSLKESRLKTMSEIEGLRARLRRLKGPPENFIEDLIKQEIEKGEKLLPVYDLDEMVMVKALEILQDFRYEDEADRPPSLLLTPYGRSLYLGGPQY